MDAIIFQVKKDGKPYWIFTLLYMTSNIWSFQFYFSLQQAEVAFAMLLMAVTGFFMCDLCFCEKYKENRSGKDLCKLFLSTVFIVLALGTYQALAVYYIAVCAMFEPIMPAAPTIVNLSFVRNSIIFFI